MKFNCADCQTRMKFQEATGTSDGGMLVTSVCTTCRNRITLVANPGETMLLKALNAGHSGQALMAELMESVARTLTEMGEHNYPIEPTVASDRLPTWQERAEEWVWTEPGRFLMGSPESEPGRETDEPQHEVVISRGFYLGKCSVTQGQWTEVMGTEPWSSRAGLATVPTHPAVFISWNEMQDFVSRLNAVSEQWHYRLPTEAEWEFSCRAGTTLSWSFGEDRHLLWRYAWNLDSGGDSEDQSTQEVGTKLPNPWGLHDMHGNVWEWCQDVYSAGYYLESPALDPPGPEGAPESCRVVRGGYFRYFTRHSRSAARNARWPDERHRALGARLLRTAVSDRDDSRDPGSAS